MRMLRGVLPPRVTGVGCATLGAATPFQCAFGCPVSAARAPRHFRAYVTPNPRETAHGPRADERACRRAGDGRGGQGPSARRSATAEDALIASLILTSRLHIEAALGLALITQSWRLHARRLADRRDRVALPLRPVQAVSAVRVRDGGRDAGGRAGQLDYLVDGRAAPPRLVASQQRLAGARRVAAPASRSI